MIMPGVLIQEHFTRQWFMYKGLHATRQNQAGKTTETHVVSTEYWIATFVATGTQNIANDELLKFRRSCWNAAAGPFHFCSKSMWSRYEFAWVVQRQRWPGTRMRREDTYQACRRGSQAMKQTRRALHWNERTQQKACVAALCPNRLTAPKTS